MFNPRILISFIFYTRNLSVVYLVRPLNNLLQMKIYYKKTGLTVATCILLGLPTLSLISFSNQAPTGKTGSPTDGSSCVSCHSTFAVQELNDIISTNIPQEGYISGETYSITVSGMGNSIAQKYGFSLTAEDASGNKIGSFTAGTNSVVSGNHIGHKPASSSSTPSWTFAWTAPISGNGTITLYAACVIADGLGSSSNDAVVTSNVAFNENLGTSLNSISQNNFDAFISGSQLSILNKSSNQINKVIISNGMGQIVAQKTINSSNLILNIDISDIKSGIYFILIQTEKGVISKQVFK